ncbi:hypothetical protein ACTOB_001685 [Actinoplanes oblitus]|uniref:Uncharacterized protein n=1 Tax=Actinoplanes oblitus TaxID=3040509 RepID=A0ABY8WJQ6_9ACTN|nr:hypothetical protein [Actinoplanes oblitus]WIM98109.1 hypothetical protein ACTOB_001685 [Actinoplanes oblitus]
MKFSKALAAAAAATVVLTGLTTTPASAAYKTTTFAQMHNSIGGTANAVVTWYNRSVQISYTVTDPDSGGLATLLSFEGLSELNGGDDVITGVMRCGDHMVVNGRSVHQNYNCTINFDTAENVLVKSVRLEIGYVGSDGYWHVQGRQTKNRPS